MTPPLSIGCINDVDKCVLLALADRLMGLLEPRMRPTAAAVPIDELIDDATVLEITLISAPPGNRELFEDSEVVMNGPNLGLLPSSLVTATNPYPYLMTRAMDSIEELLKLFSISLQAAAAGKKYWERTINQILEHIIFYKSTPYSLPA
jgi:hypothetical protein